MSQDSPQAIIVLELKDETHLITSSQFIQIESLNKIITFVSFLEIC
ncbi:MAG: hypothetical protein ACOZBL_01375 [Patescibacteria group bacterium]